MGAVVSFPLSPPRRLARGCLTCPRTATVTADLDEFEKLASDRPLPNLTQPDTQNAIRRLHRYHVIETIEGNDRIEIPLIEKWVRERSMMR